MGGYMPCIRRRSRPRFRQSAWLLLAFTVSSLAPRFAEAMSLAPSSPSIEEPAAPIGQYAGESDEQSDEGPPSESAPSESAPSASEGERRNTDVAPMDFCSLAPKDDSEAYQIQRVLMLGVAKDDSLENGPEFEVIKVGDKTEKVPRTIFKEIDPFGHAREVLFTVFPMKRHYLILADPTPEEFVTSKQPFELDRARQLLVDDRLAAYSVGCTDWLVAPYMVRRGEATWTQVKREKTVKGKKVEYMAWDLSVAFDLRMEIFRRDGDGFVHHATIAGANGGLRAVTNRRAQTMAAGSWAQVQSSVSVGLPFDCPIPPVGADSVAFSACGGVSIDYSVEGMSSMGLGQRAGPYCKDLDDSVQRGQDGMRDVAKCVLRQQMENATQEIQLEAKKVCGWRLFSGLHEVSGSKHRGVSMGKHEGARRGDYYIARKGGSSSNAQCIEGKEVGFGRITKLGPGGENGKAEPSLVKFRTGNPPVGTHMTEYAMHGARLGLEPTIWFPFLRGELRSRVAGGGVLRLGYDLSRLIPVFDEIWSVGGIGVLRGVGRETFMTYDVGIEINQYLFKRLSVFGSFGTGGTTAFKKVPNPVPDGEDVLLSGGVFALYLRGGPEVVVRPDWHLRFLVEARSGLHRATLENEEDAPGETRDGGHLLGLSAGLSVAHTF